MNYSSDGFFLLTSSSIKNVWPNSQESSSVALEGVKIKFL